MALASQVNKNYIVTFTSTSNGNAKDSIVVQGHTPDVLSFSMGNDFSAPFYGALENAVKSIPFVGNLASLGARMAGVNIGFTQQSSALMWEGMKDRSTFEVKLQFNCETNPVTDVLTPFLNLVKMAIPDEPTPGLLVLPQPNMAGEIARNAAAAGVNLSEDVANHTRTISFSYGQTFIISPIVIWELRILMEPNFDAAGNPMTLDVGVVFTPFYTPIASNLDGKNHNPLLYSFSHADVQHGPYGVGGAIGTDTSTNATGPASANTPNSSPSVLTNVGQTLTDFINKTNPFT